MDALDIIDQHLIIRDTVGYEVFNQVPIEDIPKVMEFLKIIYNYNRMKRVVEKDKEPGWVDPMMEMLDREEKESEWQRRKQIMEFSKIKKKEKEIDPTIAATADFLDKEKSNFDRILEREMKAFAKKIGWGVEEEIENAVVSDTPASSWMDAYRGEYDAILKSGMFFEWHPTWTGVWDRDKYAFCHDRKYKKK